MANKLKTHKEIFEPMPEGKVWVTSDTHFYHKSAIKYCRRPFATVEEMNEALIRNWNSCVRPEDTIIVVGDFAFAGTQKMKEILDRLNGHKWLVLGNHDEKASKCERAGFEKVCSDLYLVNSDDTAYRFNHFPYHRGIVEYFCQMKIVFESLLHLQFKRALEWAYITRELPKKGKEDRFYHGHTHSKSTGKGSVVHVGVDAHNFYPIRIK